MKVYIDCDPGIDDTYALGYLLTRPDLEIVGIGSVAGNTSLEKANRNLKLITSVLQPNVNIYKGSSCPIIETRRNAEHFHGSDGLANFWESEYFRNNSTEIESLVSKSIFSENQAPLALLELSKKYSGDLVILALGPLTNIALAHLLDPEFGSRIDKIIIMGGNSFGPGNSQYYIGSEFNFSIDPESVQIVFNKINCTKLVYPLDVLGSPTISQICFDRWKKHEIFDNILQTCFSHMSSLNYKGIPYDLIAAVVMVHPSVIKKCQNRNVTIELNSTLNRGRIIVDTRNNCFENHGNGCETTELFSSISMIEELDEPKIIEILNNF